MTFDARRFHQVEPHEGRMWALAAYVPQAFTWILNENAKRLSSLLSFARAKNSKNSADFIER